MHVFGAKCPVGGGPFTQEGGGHTAWQVPQQKGQGEPQGFSGQSPPWLCVGQAPFS